MRLPVNLFQKDAIKMVRLVVLNLVLGVLLVLSACTGDGRPIQEAVETDMLNLIDIRIDTPDGFASKPVLNHGDKLKFTLVGITKSGEVALSGDNRRWAVNDPNLVSINQDGVLTAKADGEVLVEVQVGGWTAITELTVEQAQLRAIEISKSDTSAMAELEPCLPENYTAIGTYESSVPGGESRPLFNVAWSLADPTQGSIGTLDDIGLNVPVTGFSTTTEIDTFKLIASVDIPGSDIPFSDEETITVLNSLSRIDITPNNLDLELGGSAVNISARGNYNVVEGKRLEAASLPITNSVAWSLPDNNNVVTLSDEDMLRAVEIGGSSITASCGNISTTKTIQVLEEGSTANVDLVFQGGSSRTIRLSEMGVQLRLSNGGSYSATNDKTNDATWTIDSDNGVVEFRPEDPAGFITPLRVGTDKVVAEYDGQSIVLDITVDP